MYGCLCQAYCHPVHQEAFSGIICLLKEHPPTPSLTGALLTLPLSFDRLATCVLSNWARTHPELLRRQILEVNYLHFSLMMIDIF